MTTMIASSVNRRFFPHGVALDDTPLGHLEFALRHEGVNLEVIDAAFEHIAPRSLIERLRAAPNGEYIRRACFLWECAGCRRGADGQLRRSLPARRLCRGREARDAKYNLPKNDISALIRMVTSNGGKRPLAGGCPAT